jgi:hypothetical protein
MYVATTVWTAMSAGKGGRRVGRRGSGAGELVVRRPAWDVVGVVAVRGVVIRVDRHAGYKATGDLVVPNASRLKVVNGALSVDLPAGNDPDLDEPFFCSVHEVVPGGRKFTISVPYDASGPLKLHDLIVERDYQEIQPPRIYTLNPATGSF